MMSVLDGSARHYRIWLTAINGPKRAHQVALPHRQDESGKILWQGASKWGWEWTRDIQNDEIGYLATVIIMVCHLASLKVSNTAKTH
jgi:hypothetical protein